MFCQFEKSTNSWSSNISINRHSRGAPAKFVQNSWSSVKLSRASIGSVLCQIYPLEGSWPSIKSRASGPVRGENALQPEPLPHHLPALALHSCHRSWTSRRCLFVFVVVIVLIVVVKHAGIVFKCSSSLLSIRRCTSSWHAWGHCQTVTSWT